MRKITRRIIEAFNAETRLIVDNTVTDGQSIWLFNNKIVKRIDGEVWISNAGWKTRTTMERLNGLEGVHISTNRGAWFLNGHPWDGDWTCISAHPVVADEFDVTSTWMAKERYSRPVYAVCHTHTEVERLVIQCRLRDAGIPYRQMESDTQGQYKPNYFLIVEPKNLDIAKSLV